MLISHPYQDVLLKTGSLDARHILRSSAQRNRFFTQNFKFFLNRHIKFILFQYFTLHYRNHRNDAQKFEIRLARLVRHNAIYFISNSLKRSSVISFLYSSKSWRTLYLGSYPRSSFAFCTSIRQNPPHFFSGQ